MRLPCLFAAAALLVACPKSEPSAPEAGASAEAGARADTGPATQDRSDDDDVHPVYPIEGVAPHPTAVKLCAALHDLPERRRSACCSEPGGAVFTDKCVQALSAAIRGGAVQVDAAKVDACAAAMDRAYEGCDWVGPFPPELPPDCLSVVKGTLPAKARCRSSLECSGNQRCHGVGPTTPGKCGPPRDDGGPCGGTTDALASYVRQDDVDDSHPECKGFCSRTKCASPAPEGAACALTRECGQGLQCIGAAKNPPLGAKTGKCTARPPDRAGQACPGQVCEKGLLCIAGTCTARKPAGSACSTDFECIGGCLKPDAGTAGRCGRKCGAR
jgi:hypothetical protein